MTSETELIDERLNATVQASTLTAWDILSNREDRLIGKYGEINFLYLPPMQRRFVWGADKARQLITDIINVPENSPKFLGIIQGSLTTDGRNNTFELVEGQQRLITLYLWYMSAFHWILENSESIDLAEPELDNRRFNFVRPSFSGKAIVLNDDSDIAASIEEISVLDPEEKPDITQNKIKEVFKSFINWWDENPIEHPDGFVKDMLINNTAFLFVNAPRFAAPQRFIDQSKSQTLTLYDKLVAQLMDQTPEAYPNDISANVELNYLKEHVKDYFEGNATPEFLNIAQKWKVDLSDIATARRSIAELKVDKDFDDTNTMAEESVFELLADTLLVREKRIPYYTRKATKLTLIDEYETVLPNAVEAIGLGLVHSRHRDSNHEGTSKTNILSKTLAVKNDQAIGQLASHLVNDPEPIKERLQRVNKLLERFHKLYLNYHNVLHGNETNLGNMFPEKDIQNVIGTLAYYEENNPVLVDAVLDSIVFMQSWLNILDFSDLRKDVSQKWEFLFCSLIEKSGRRKWEEAHVKRIQDVTKLLIAEAISESGDYVQIDKLQYYILNGDTPETDGRRVEYILHDLFGSVNEKNKKGNLSAFESISWKSGFMNFNLLLKASQWFAWAVDNHWELFVDKKVKDILKRNKIAEEKNGELLSLITNKPVGDNQVWIPSKTKPFAKDAPTTEQAMWLFEPSNLPFRNNIGNSLFLAMPVSYIDMLSMNEEGIIAGKLGCFVEDGEKIVIDESFTSYNPKVLPVILRVALESVDGGYRSDKLYNEFTNEIFQKILYNTFDPNDYPKQPTSVPDELEEEDFELSEEE